MHCTQAINFSKRIYISYVVHAFVQVVIWVLWAQFMNHVDSNVILGEILQK